MAIAAKMKRSAKKAAPEGNVHDRDYEAFLTSLSFSIVTKAGSAPVFKTDLEPDVLWETYLRAFKPTERKFHDCSACRGFIKRFGGLVTVDAAGRTTPLVWVKGVPPEYAPSFAAACKRVKQAEVTGPFFSREKTWGTPLTGIWRHMAAPAPAQSVMPMAGPRMAEKREDFATVLRALSEFPPSLLDRAVEVLDTADLYRSEKVLGQATWLRDLHRARMEARSPELRRNLTWLAIATAPAGFCHPRSSMIGTLLEDLASGASLPEVKARFAEKMSPLQYQRPTAPPSEQNIARAEKLVEELGITRSLERRFALVEEVEAEWRPLHRPGGGGVFGRLRHGPAPSGFMGAGQKITFTRFMRDVAPHAVAMHLCVPPTGNFAAITTALHRDAPPILQWDRPERRNPFAWYVYAQGSRSSGWGLTYNNWQLVTALTLQPSQWFGADLPHQGRSAFFLLDQARDSLSPSSGLFPEMLRSELREVRATIEAHSRTSTLAGREDATACGLRTNNDGSLGAPLWVAMRSGGAGVYIIDRWE